MRECENEQGRDFDPTPKKTPEYRAIGLDIDGGHMVPNMRWTGMSDGEHESELLIERWARKGGFEPKKKTKNQAVEAQFPQTNCGKCCM